MSLHPGAKSLEVKKTGQWLISMFGAAKNSFRALVPASLVQGPPSLFLFILISHTPLVAFLFIIRHLFWLDTGPVDPELFEDKDLTFSALFCCKQHSWYVCMCVWCSVTLTVEEHSFLWPSWWTQLSHLRAAVFWVSPPLHFPPPGSHSVWATEYSQPFLWLPDHLAQLSPVVTVKCSLCSFTFSSHACIFSHLGPFDKSPRAFWSFYFISLVVRYGDYLLLSFPQKH